MRARPAGPAQSSVFHNFARRGPTKEAHRRAMNRSGGLLRSVAGQGKRAEARFLRYPGGLGIHQGRDTGTHQGRDQGSRWGTDPGAQQPNQTIPKLVSSGDQRIAEGITADGEGPGA